MWNINVGKRIIAFSVSWGTVLLRDEFGRDQTYCRQQQLLLWQMHLTIIASIDLELTPGSHRRKSNRCRPNWRQLTASAHWLSIIRVRKRRFFQRLSSLCSRCLQSIIQWFFSVWILWIPFCHWTKWSWHHTHRSNILLAIDLDGWIIAWRFVSVRSWARHLFKHFKLGLRILMINFAFNY